MSTSRRFALAAALGLVGTLTLSGCTGTPGASAPTSTGAASLSEGTPSPPTGTVIGTGTVLEDAEGVRLCLGPVRESAPPQCEGLPLEGWSWEGLNDAVIGDEASWGTYAVRGTFDGETFRMTGEPVTLALYDPVAGTDPTGGGTGETTEARLLTVQHQVEDEWREHALSTTVERGYLWVDVIWDDGTLQSAADDAFGEDVVVVRSALQPVE